MISDNDERAWRLHRVELACQHAEKQLTPKRGENLRYILLAAAGLFVIQMLAQGALGESMLLRAIGVPLAGVAIAAGTGRLCQRQGQRQLVCLWRGALESRRPTPHEVQGDDLGSSS